MTQKIIWGLKNEYFFNVFDQNMSIENLNSMLSEARQNFLKFLCYLCIRRCNLGLRI